MKSFFAATLALSMLAAPAFAAPRDNQNGDQGQYQGQHQGRPNGNDAHQGQDHGDRSNGQTQNQNTGNSQHQGQTNGNGQGNGQAQNQNNGNGQWDHSNGNSQWGQNNGGRDHDARPQAHRQYAYNGRQYDAVRGPAWNAPRGYDARRMWNRGDRLPEGYRHRAYVVDYRAYHLARPSYGYQWVRVGNSVYLVRASNGIVAQIVWNMFY